MAETKQTISAREKWQQEVAATLQSDAMTSGMFVNEMKQSFNSQNQFWAQGRTNAYLPFERWLSSTLPYEGRT